MATPSADEAPENQGRQDGEGKKDETSVDRAALERVHGFGWFNWGNSPAHDPPLDEVCHHQQVEQDERGRPPPARLGFANSDRKRNHSLPYRLPIVTTALHTLLQPCPTPAHSIFALNFRGVFGKIFSGRLLFEREYIYHRIRGPATLNATRVSVVGIHSSLFSVGYQLEVQDNV